jgi:hypothetical protein
MVLVVVVVVVVLVVVVVVVEDKLEGALDKLLLVVWDRVPVEL